MEGRSKFLKGEEATSVMAPFENALKLLGSDKMRSRVGLHLINYYLNHLNNMYSDKAFESRYQAISKRIDELFKEFDKCRLPSSSKKDKPLEPIKTLLQLHFGLHKIHKMQRDLCLNSSGLRDSQKIKTDIDNTRTKLLYTALMLGLGSLNPCPPLLQDIYNFANNQQSMFDSNEAKSMLKKHLNNLDYESFERVALVYFKHMNYEVKMLEKNTKAYDLIASRKFEGSIGINAEARVGIQAKYWGRKFYSRDFENWLLKAMGSEISISLTGIVFFLKGSLHKDVATAAEAAKSVFKNLQTGIIFWDLDMITDMLWSKPGCLPMVYGVIENLERDKDNL